MDLRIGEVEIVLVVLKSSENEGFLLSSVVKP